MLCLILTLRRYCLIFFILNFLLMRGLNYLFIIIMCISSFHLEGIKGVYYFFSISFLILLLALIYLLNFNKYLDLVNKRNSFECGFNPFSNPNTPFNLPYFYITLIFLIFDLELALLIFFPLFNREGSLTYLYTLYVLLLILLVTIYE